MDSRLRGNDNGITRYLSVIPAQAGIHADTPRKFKESIHTYLKISCIFRDITKLSELCFVSVKLWCKKRKPLGTKLFLVFL